MAVDVDMSLLSELSPDTTKSLPMPALPTPKFQITSRFPGLQSSKISLGGSMGSIPESPSPDLKIKSRD